MITLAVVIGILLLIAFLRVGVSAEYGESGIILRAHIGPASILLYPREKKVEQEPSERKKKKLEKKQAEQEQKPGALSILKALLPPVKKALSQVKRKILVNKLTVYYISGGTDAADTAITFGRVSAGMGVLLPILDGNFRIRKHDFRSGFDFQREEPYVYVNLRMSFAVWELVYIGVGFLVSFLKGMMKSKAEFIKKRKLMTNSNGKVDL